MLPAAAILIAGLGALLVPLPSSSATGRCAQSLAAGCARAPPAGGAPRWSRFMRLRGGDGDQTAAAQRHLFEAAQRGDVDAIEAAVARGADVGAGDPLGALAIHMASAQGRTAGVRALLRLGAAVDSRLRSGPSALHLAAEGGHDETAAVLLESGADVDAPAEFVEPNGSVVGCSWTPIFFAAAHGHLEVVRCMLKYGARVQLRDETGLSPLDLAERWRERPRDLARDQSVLEARAPSEEREALVKLLQGVSGKPVRTVPEQDGLDSFRLEQPIPESDDDDDETAGPWPGAAGHGHPGTSPPMGGADGGAREGYDDWAGMWERDGRPISPPPGFDDIDLDEDSGGGGRDGHTTTADILPVEPGRESGKDAEEREGEVVLEGPRAVEGVKRGEVADYGEESSGPEEDQRLADDMAEREIQSTLEELRGAGTQV